MTKGLERVSFKWNHLDDKNSLKNNNLEYFYVLIRSKNALKGRGAYASLYRYLKLSYQEHLLRFLRWVIILFNHDFVLRQTLIRNR
jgi:hypothetical protein